MLFDGWPATLVRPGASRALTLRLPDGDRLNRRSVSWSAYGEPPHEPHVVCSPSQPRPGALGGCGSLHKHLRRHGRAGRPGPLRTGDASPRRDVLRQASRRATRGGPDRRQPATGSWPRLPSTGMIQATGRSTCPPCASAVPGYPWTGVASDNRGRQSGLHSGQQVVWPSGCASCADWASAGGQAAGRCGQPRYQPGRPRLGGSDRRTAPQRRSCGVRHLPGRGQYVWRTP